MASTSTPEPLDGHPAGLTPAPDRAELTRDVGRLLLALGRDARVPWRAKAVAAAGVAYALTPSRVLPTPLRQLSRTLGAIDNTVVLLAAVRHLVAEAGYDLVRELWTGTDRGFAMVLLAAGVES